MKKKRSAPKRPRATNFSPGLSFSAIAKSKKKKTVGLLKQSYQARYGDSPKDYAKQCAKAHNLTKQKCCCCLVKPSEEIHHAAYGNDQIGITVFPVCRECHKAIAHHPDNWIVSRQDKVWGSKNTPGFTEQLIAGFSQLATS